MQEKNSSPKRRLPDLTWPLAVVSYSLFFAFVVTSNGVTNWDDRVRISHSNWLLGIFGLGPKVKTPHNYSYAPLWELTMGTVHKFVFGWMHDEIWVRHALTFSLLPIGLTILYYVLRKENLSKWSALLCIAGITSYIRLIGHATMNVKDFPSAIVYLICAVGIWRILMHIKQHTFSMKPLALLGIVSALPFLIRSPLLTLLPLTYIFLFFHVLQKRKELNALQVIMTFFIPAISAGLFIVMLSPSLWWLRTNEIKDSTVKFVNYPWGGHVKFFGLQYRSYNLPRWYPLTWIPVGIHITGFAAFISGLFLLAQKSRHLPLRAVQWGIKKIKVSVTLVDWLALVTAASWAGILIIHPTLYDEDRHLLFLMLPLYTVGFLGLQVLHEKTKKYLTIFIVLCSVIALYRWNIYAYIYQSPLISAFYTSNDFMNDYYGTCGSRAGRYLLKELGDDKTDIVITYSRYTGTIAVSNAIRRANDGFFSTAKKIVEERRPKGRESYWHLLTDTRSTDPMKNPALFGAKKIELKWQDKLPTGEVMCSLYYITPR